jgi:hypothetical protein
VPKTDGHLDGAFGDDGKRFHGLNLKLRVRAVNQENPEFATAHNGGLVNTLAAAFLVGAILLGLLGGVLFAIRDLLEAKRRKVEAERFVLLFGPLHHAPLSVIDGFKQAGWEFALGPTTERRKRPVKAIRSVAAALLLFGVFAPRPAKAVDGKSLLLGIGIGAGIYATQHGIVPAAKAIGKASAKTAKTTAHGVKRLVAGPSHKPVAAQ